MLDNATIIAIAMRQSALDIRCAPADFLRPEPVIVRSEIGPEARKYYREPIACNLVSYGNNVVASTRDEYRAVVEAYIRRYPAYHCFETPHLHWLADRLSPLGQKICFMAEYYLPDVTTLPARAAAHTAELDARYTLRSLGPADFTDLYKPEWSNALCADRAELDVLGIGAYDGDDLVGLAACSADCDTMWQIGIDVLPAHRRRGLAATLTARLAMDILERGKIPFYCSAWSNIPSVRNAVKAGFIPTWVEMTVKPATLVNDFNRTETD